MSEAQEVANTLLPQLPMGARACWTIDDLNLWVRRQMRGASEQVINNVTWALWIELCKPVRRTQ